MKRERPVVSALQKFTEMRPMSWHVPGHKNGLLSNLPSTIKEALTYDLTELTGLDDYHHPEEAIAQAEELLAKTYQARKSFFLVNGSTVGNLAMIYATCKRNEKIIVQRNAHKSIFHALELVGAKAIFIAPAWDEATTAAGAVPTATLKEALQVHPDAKAVVLTYPTYYGVAGKEMALQIKMCQELKIPVLVDEAHGAHLIASKDFPPSAIQLGADIVVQSAHKTLPAMTMASFLHVNSDLIHPERINHYLRMLQSSSPSYLLLASLDDARDYIDSYLESDANYLKDKRNQWIEALRSVEPLQVIEVDDPLKLLLRIPGYTGYQLKEVLEQQGIFVELADPYQALLILPLLKHGQAYPFAEARIRIKEAIFNLRKIGVKTEQTVSPSKEFTTVSIPEYSYDELDELEKEWVPYMRAIGRVSASMLIPYPPGIPLFLPGEKITVAKLSQLEELLATGAAFQGQHRLNEKLLYVIK
ncbi:aminotransferase class I/II-fold pyridoxal phosphate-dependent enzyme [Ureibacillus aquaedulcis]|uniref:Aminotransferase class I/II-fold pyridoxal phosphate-dependent enzyme n=1 Tax=Ureibacillus aquaedulcis TaxID=3058421 RepID=A0ABT8GVL9_9BACL|nr:aminotransferase class I/II-fold pyridoxal phosphate-dependent enzyme [Ureibacillus sp. BA0131]MDN4495406.1 aminotransferase class I/II-fold pyridoxal phosphate-dependent enzyme [Ureibacillus sp. BA0131]